MRVPLALAAPTQEPRSWLRLGAGFFVVLGVTPLRENGNVPVWCRTPGEEEKR